MALFQIISLAGVDMGMHEGATPNDAVEAMHRDAGYASTADAAARTGASVTALRAGVRIIEVRLIDYETGAYLRSATPEELEASLAAAETDGGAGVIRVDGRRCYAQ